MLRPRCHYAIYRQVGIRGKHALLGSQGTGSTLSGSAARWRGICPRSGCDFFRGVKRWGGGEDRFAGISSGGVVGAARKEAGEIPPYATRRAKTARKKKPGRSARNDKKRPAKGGG